MSGPAGTPSDQMAEQVAEQVAEQAAVIDFLSHADSYGLPAGEVERVETHCSIVFLAGDRAYKLKRAIRYASLDYTTREQRRAACEAELVLNRRTAPDLYLAVQAVRRGENGGLSFEGSGAALDHVVVMRRFAQADLFDHLAGQGLLTPERMRTLGGEIARFHLRAERMPGFGGEEAIRRVITVNDRELARVAITLDGAEVGALSHGSGRAVDLVASLLERRRLEGRVRRCHGDLRLANICLYAGRPTMFDCIEFSEEISCIDVLYDLGFLLMDLHVRGHAGLGNAVFNAYLDVAPETDGLRTLPLFLAVRAATRSYALAGGAGRQTDPLEASRLAAAARQHIAAGIAFLLPPPPVLVMLGGGSARGRAELSAALAPLVPPVPGARTLSLTDKEAAWREVSAVLAAGCPVIGEADCSRAAERDRAAGLAATLEVRFVGLWLGVPPAGLDLRCWHPLGADRNGPDLLASAASVVAA